VSAENSSRGIYVWPVQLAAGIRKGNLFTLYYASFVMVGFLSLINVLQPYILIEHLKIPEGEEGALTGIISFLTESIMILLGFLVGAFSDRTGRNILFAGGFLVLAAGFAAYANVVSVPGLYTVRILLAVGAVLVGVMFTSVQTDYPQEAHRGKLLGMTALITALGVNIAVVGGGQLPTLFQAQGFSPVQAGARTMYILAGLALFSALVMRMGLKRGRPASAREQLPFRQVIRDGLGAGQNRRIMLCYLTAFVARADMTVVGLFFTLWVTTTGVEQGMETADALARATMYFGAFNVVSLLWAPVMGLIIDKLDRVMALAIAVTLAAIGYGSLCLINDPFGDPLFWPALVLLGIGVISPVLASQALLGQETRPELRGAVNGIFTATGAAGILMISLSGGFLFDVWKQYPFLLVAILNILLLLAAFVLNRNNHPGKPSPI
jgi:MFS family permease